MGIGEAVELARWVEHPWIAGAGAFGVLAAWHRWDSLPAHARRAWVAFASLALASFAVRAFALARHRLAIRAEWDFLGFWVHGRAAWRGVDLYDPAALRALDLPWAPSAGWASELLVAGSVYPPFTSFLFAPFGAFEYETAYALWCGANALALGAAVAWAGRRFFGAHPHGWLAAASLVALLRATLYTVHTQQSSALVLLCLVAMAARPAGVAAGVALALAVVVKPFAAGFALVPLVERRGRVLVAAALAGAALVVGSAALWGAAGYVDYATRPPSATLPPIAFDQPVSQSLAAALSRGLGWGREGRRPEREPLFLATAAAMTGLTVVALVRRGRGEPRGAADDDGRNALALGLLVALALVVYPGSKHHYGLLLALPAWALFEARARLRVPAAPDAVAALVGVTWAAVAWRTGAVSWVVFVAWWAVMLWAVVRAPVPGPRALDAARS